MDSQQSEFLKSMLARVRKRTGAAPIQQTKSRFSHASPGEEVRSGPGPDARDPKLLGALLDNYVVQRGWDTDVRLGQLRTLWPDIVGPDNADHVTIEAIELSESGQSATIIARADSTAWATQFRYFAPSVLKQIATEINSEIVTEIRVLAPAAPSWKHGLRSVPGRGPRDTYG